MAYKSGKNPKTAWWKMHAAACSQKQGRKKGSEEEPDILSSVVYC